jgi:UDP-N-acetylmuramoyl-L-alanyl-D-glutamate--2,6-diaminopimelate ligase
MAVSQHARAPARDLRSLLDDPSLPSLAVSGIQSDSRDVRQGDLFLALPGERHDGRHFIPRAVSRGACAVVAEEPVAREDRPAGVPLFERRGLREQLGPIAARFYADPSAQLRMTGVTGTNGKTTVTQLAGQLLRACGQRCGVIGTLGAALDGRPGAAVNTTPDAIGLQAQLAQWRDAAVESVVMEVSSHALVQDRVKAVHFDTAIFTNLSHDHLDYHGSMAAYAQAKQRLFLMPGLRRAVVNMDDPAAAGLLAGMPATVERLLYSVRDPEADLYVQGLGQGPAGLRGRLVTPWGEATFACPLIGRFNLANIAAAVAAAVLSGASFADVVEALPGLRAVPGRMQLVPNTRGLQVVIDYAHTPDALEQVLCALQPGPGGRVFVVFGCGGDRDRGKRAAMGCIACAHGDRVIVTSDNPRFENPQDIIEEVAAGCSGDFECIVDREAAIRAAIAAARDGDCVLIAGKGHEDYQQVGDEKRPFSDLAVATAALEGPAS